MTDQPNPPAPTLAHVVRGHLAITAAMAEQAAREADYARIDLPTPATPNRAQRRAAAKKGRRP